MGIAERRQREREQRRHDIVDAAERVFFSRGWDHTTMDDVADEAELAKATLYLYFRSKEELYSAVLLRGMEIMVGMFERAVAAGDTGFERTEAVGRAYVEFADRHPDYFHAMIHFAAKRDDAERSNCEQACDELGEHAIAVVADAIASGIADGSIDAGLDPLGTAITLWAQTTGILQIHSTRGREIEKNHGLTRDDLLEDFFRFAERALRPTSGETTNTGQ